jgi:hypothetical protein
MSGGNPTMRQMIRLFVCAPRQPVQGQLFSTGWRGCRIERFRFAKLDLIFLVALRTATHCLGAASWRKVADPGVAGFLLCAREKWLRPAV